MSCRDNPEKSPRNRYEGPTPASARQNPPVILVPATPPAANQAQDAAGDAAAPAHPLNYAQAAALPAAQNHVIVWPVNPPTAVDPRATPVLRPQVTQDGDNIPTLVLPPPALSATLSLPPV